MFPSLIYLERFRNEETRTYSTHSDYSEATENYRPNTEHDGFALKTFNIPKAQLNIYLANPAEDLYKAYLGNAADDALFCVHPQVFETQAQDPYIDLLRNSRETTAIDVIPSSSTRTLFALSGAPHALKVHFPFRISRYGRKMRDEVIEQAIRVSLDIEQHIESFDSAFAYLREVIGVSLRQEQCADQESSRGENWGYLVRDMRPFPDVAEERILMPGFALYGRDLFDASIEPLLYKLIGDKDPLDFVLKKIMLPIISHWIQCYRSLGYILEPHGQNVLLELDQQHNICRIVHRDLSTGIDMRRRRDLGLNSEHLNNYNRMEYGEFISIAYDMFIGNHFFNNIVACCIARYQDLCEEDFRAPCREQFAEKFPEYEQYCPPTIRYFNEELDQYGKPGYLDTGEKPLWRP